MEVSQLSSAQRIKEARIKAGLSAEEVAKIIDLGIHAYDDLESYDDEVFNCISLKQLRNLSELLSVRAIDLVVIDQSKINETSLTAQELIECIKNTILENSESVDDFSDRVGWDVTSALNNAENVWKDWNLDGLRDICEAVGVNWIDVLNA